jgi:VWFA-related protein
VRPTPLRALIAAVAAWVAVPLAAQDAVFRSFVDIVAVDVSVQQRGKPVGDLTPADFDVRDNGVPQKVINASRETLPIDVTLLLDLSSSVAGPLFTSLTRAIGEVGNALRADDTAQLITFNHRIHEVGDLKKIAIVGPGTLGTPGGGTALLDAMASGLVARPDPNRRHMAIVFTDGRDASSFLDEPTVLELAARGGMSVFAVAVTDGTHAIPMAAAHANFLTSVAATTGGQLAVIQRDEDLQSSFLRAFDDFRTSYVLHYSPAGTTRGGWHELTVRVSKPGAFDVRARKGYYGS